MLVLLSPAKTMTQRMDCLQTVALPNFLDETKFIMEHLQSFQVEELEQIMKISPKIACQNYERYQKFTYDEFGTPAIFSYTGLQYKNICADSFTAKDLEFANQCIRIISGLYGVLAPNSSVYPYRLDFAMKLGFPGYSNLYEVWGNKIFDFLSKEDDIMINLASKEYAKVILPYVKPGVRVITCSFYVEKNGKQKMESTAAKMARGLMTSYIVRNRLREPEGLKSFGEGGFLYEKTLSSDGEFVFIRRA